MAFKMKGIPRFTKNKVKWNGPTHKMEDGTLHTGKTHNEDSEELFHKGDSALKKKLNHTNTKCWPGCSPKSGTPKTKISSNTGERVNNCDCNK